MALRGCISVSSLPLQVLLRDHPAWKSVPVAVTREERPQSPILVLNRAAREKGLAPGMKYASALALVPSLRAREVPQGRIEEARDLIVRLLSSFTPDIEPCPFDQDAVWVSLDGLRTLFTSESNWIHVVRAALASEGFAATIVAGFTRFGTYAMARSRPRSMVFASREEEHELMGRSSVDILPLPYRVRSTLRKLEIRTVRQFAVLPAGETVRRFGKEAGLIRRAIVSDDPLPIQPVPVKEARPCTRHLDAPLSDLGLLMPHVEELLAIEAARAEAERSVISGLTLLLRTEEGKVTTDAIRPAVPTLRLAVLQRLIRLRLSARQFSSGVEAIELRSARTQPSRVQEELFAARGRDLQAGARAFAAIRARFGNGSLTWARPGDSHLPERSFQWVPLRRPVLPAPRREAAVDGRPAAVRRILFTPGQARQALHANTQPEERGPFIVSGSWWGAGGKGGAGSAGGQGGRGGQGSADGQGGRGAEAGQGGQDAPFEREYRFTDSTDGTLWWYLDRLSGAAWIQGVVD